MADEITTEPTRSGPQLTHSQAVNRCRELSAEVERLADIDDPSTEEEAEFVRLAEEFESTDKWRKHLEREALRGQVRSVVTGELRDASTRYGKPGVAGRIDLGSHDTYDRDAILEPDSIEAKRFRNPWDLSEVRTFGRDSEELRSEYRARALSAVEQMPAATDRIRSAATNLIEEWDDEEGRLSRLALALSEPVYLRAWSKMARSPHAPNLDEAEQKAVGRVQSSARALSLTDSAGGFLVPFQLDPTVIITANGSVNQIRQVARQVVATGDVWHGVSAGAVSWSYAGEGDEADDNSPAFAQPTVPVHKAQGFVPISMEALQDAANITSEVGRLLAFGKDVLESNAFALGDGSGKPTGIVTALADASPSVTVDSTELALADAYSVQGALPARYRGGASWLGNNLTYNTLRQLDGGENQGVWSQLEAGRPANLLGKPALESEDMASESGNVLVFGDFTNYVIADRIGTTVEFIPHLFGANRRPTGQRGWFAYVRHGADSVNSGAFRLLNVGS
jgi:HK97 family phage major capsid protein